MSRRGERVIHTEVMELRASPAQVREFILTPQRILDYYPEPQDGGVLEPGRAIYCRGAGGVSLLERIEPECTDRRVALKVTTAIGLEPPYTRQRIESGASFSMVEDWDLAASRSGTTLTKTWRDVIAIAPAPFPLEEAIRQGAIHERDALIEGWNRAARRE